MSHPPVHRFRRSLLVICAVFAAGPLAAADLEDLLHPDKLAKHLKAREDQKPVLAGHVQRLRQTIADYQWERGKQTCEARLWQAHRIRPDIRELRELRKNTRKAVDAIVDTLKAGLDPKQTGRLQKLLKKDGNILDLPVSETPFSHINNTPLFPQFQTEARAYSVTLPGSPSSNDTWTYADYLRTWTVRGYIPTQRPIDAISREQAIETSHPGMQIRTMPGRSRARVVKSPLLLAATLMVPDLGRAEAELLWDYYARESEDRKTAWAHYRTQNRLDDAVLVRLKLSTPFAEGYLSLDRWIIYLEDSEGTGYEPVQVDQGAFYPLETLEISLPGREAEVTDVFGTYYPYIPGHKERIYLEAPARIVYAGHEKLLKLFFPGKTYQGQPVVTEKTEYLKLIVQSQEDEFGRAELIWDLKPRKPGAPNKDRE